MRRLNCIDESVEQRLLMEGAPKQKMEQIFIGGQGMPKDVFEQLVTADPTYKGGDKVGDYTKWMLNAYLKDPNMNIGHAKDCISRYISGNYNNKIGGKPLDKYATIATLKAAMDEIDGAIESGETVDKSLDKFGQFGEDIVYNSPDWWIIVPRTLESSRYWGGMTQWCTASSQGNYFYNDYSKDGKLYINIDLTSAKERTPDAIRNADRMYQIHFEHKECKGKRNETCGYFKGNSLIVDFSMPKHVKKWYHSNAGYRIMDLEEFMEDASKRLSNGENPKDVVDFVYSSSEGFSMVQLNGQYNFINREGRFISKDWFDDAHEFHEGFAAVELNKRWNFINSEGKLLLKCGYIGVGNFQDGFAKVEIDDSGRPKFNFINREGVCISKYWFDDTYNFHEGVALVELNDQWFLLGKDGNLYDENRQRITVSEGFSRKNNLRNLRENRVGRRRFANFVVGNRSQAKQTTNHVGRMAKKATKLTEDEMRTLVNNIVNEALEEIDGKTHARVANATKRAMQNLQNGIRFTKTTSPLSGEKHTINYDDIITKAKKTEERANTSLLEPYIDSKIMFFATNRLGRITRLIFQPNKIKKLMNGVAILSGTVIYDGNLMNGNIMIDFTKQKVFYTERHTRYKYTLDPDNRTVDKWNSLLEQLKMSLDNRI